MVEIFINGVIGADIFDQSFDDIGTTLESVRAQYNAVENPTEIKVYINSDGGRVSEGFAIHDFLRAQELPVTTIGSTVFSIASVIFMAGDKGKRYMRPNGRALVHNPMPAFGIQSDAKGYEELASILRKEEDEIVSFFAKKTGRQKAKIREMMDKDEVVTAQEFVKMGFADGIIDAENKKQDVTISPFQAKYIPPREFVAMRDKIINQQKMANKTLKERLANWLNDGQKLVNQEEIIPTPLPEEKPEDEKPNELAVLLARVEAIESQLTKANEEKELAIEAKNSAEEKNKHLLLTINQQNELIKEASQAIQDNDKRIKDLENMPLTKNQKDTPIIKKTNKMNALQRAIIDQGLAGYYGQLIN